MRSWLPANRSRYLCPRDENIELWLGNSENKLSAKMRRILISQWVYEAYNKFPRLYRQWHLKIRSLKCISQTSEEEPEMIPDVMEPDDTELKLQIHLPISPNSQKTFLEHNLVGCRGTNNVLQQKSGQTRDMVSKYVLINPLTMSLIFGPTCNVM